MTKKGKKKSKKQPKPDEIQVLSKQKDVIKSKSRFAQFFDERNKRRKELTRVKNPVIQAGELLVIYSILSIFLSLPAFWERYYHLVPFWLSSLFLLVMLINALSKFYWFIFFPNSNRWLRYRGFIDWAVVSVIIFFYFYGTGLYYVTLDILSTKILPFVSQKVNELLTNLFGWIMSGVLGNAAYDGIKWIYKKRTKGEQI